MKRIFIIITLSISLLNLLYFNLKDILTFPAFIIPDVSVLKDFSAEFHNIREVGYYSEEEDAVYMLYRIQNTIIPVVIKDSVDSDYIFCFSKDSLCLNLVMAKQFNLIKIYPNELFLLKKREINL